MNTANSYEFLRLQLERIQANGGSAQDSAECAQRFLELARQTHATSALPVDAIRQPFGHHLRKLDKLKLV